MNVAFVLTGWNRSGGGEKRLSRLAMYLNRYPEYRVSLYVNSGLFSELQMHNIINSTNIEKVIVIGELSSNYRFYRNSFLLRQLWVLYLAVNTILKLVVNKPSHVHFCGFHDFVVYISSMFCRRYSLSIVNSNFKALVGNSKYKYRMYDKIIRRAGNIDCLSRDIFQAVVTAFPSAKKNARVAPCTFIMHQKETSWDVKENRVVFLGSFFEIKNPLLYIEAISDIYKYHSEHAKKWAFHAFGSGYLEPRMREMANNLGISDLIRIEETLKPLDELAKSKIFCSLQEVNNYPSQSLIEAMSTKNAVIATDVGETRRLCNKSNSILIQKSRKQLVSALLLLMNDQERIRSLGEAAASLSRNQHNIETFADYFKRSVLS